MSTERDWSERVLAAQAQGPAAGQGGGDGAVRVGESLARSEVEAAAVEAASGEAAGSAGEVGDWPEGAREPIAFGSPEHPAPPLTAARPGRQGGRRLVRKEEAAAR